LKPESKHEAPEYEAPRIVDYGHLTDLTAGTHVGSQTDATFPRNTPKSKVLLS
jgi:hypothetical protein